MKTSASQKVEFVGEWASRSTLIVSLMAFAACTAMWLAILGLALDARINRADGLGAVLMIIVLFFWIQHIAWGGCGVALLGLAHVFIACRRFSRLLGLSLALNIVAGPIPLLLIYLDHVREYYAANPPLLRAVRSGNVQQVRALLSPSKIPPKPDDECRNAFFAAVGVGRMDMVDAFVGAYAKSSRERRGVVTYENALALASAAHNLELVKNLLQRGADPNVVPPGAEFSVAHAAVQRGDCAILRLLLDNGARASQIVGSSQDDLLTHAVKMANPKSSDFSVVKLLLSHNTERDFKKDPEYGSHLLYRAASGGSEELTRILLAAGADATVKPRDGWLPLETAVMGHWPGVVRLLLDHGADPNDSRLSFNLLIWADRDAKGSKNTEVLDMLRRHGAK